MAIYRLAVYPSWEIHKVEGVLPRVGETISFKGTSYRVTGVDHEIDSSDRGGVYPQHNHPLVKAGERLN